MSMPEEISRELINRIRMVKCVLFDVDGVLTDGTIIRMADGMEARRFSVIDGHGISMLRESGIIVGVVSREDSNIIRDRMMKLELDEIHIGVRDKSIVLNEIRERRDLGEGELAFMGDDLPDLEAFEASDLCISLKSGHKKVTRAADLVIDREGGKGAVREFCELIIHLISE